MKFLPTLVFSLLTAAQLVQPALAADKASAQAAAIDWRKDNKIGRAHV